MTPDINDLHDPSVCSCFPSSYQNMICNKIKWSTISISTALILIIVYASSGLYTLIDVTTLRTVQPYIDRNETSFWPIFWSPSSIMFSWISVLVYFIIVLLTIILICGIQCNKAWLLFLWSILMIIMLLADGIVTVLSLRQRQQQPYQSAIQIKILFSVMTIRLNISLFAIFITIFHFRQLSKAQSDHINRERMLLRYNAESGSPSDDNSWRRSVGLLNPAQDNNDEHYIPDIPSTMSLPRAKVATVQRHRLSTMFNSRTSLQPPTDYIDHTHQLPLNEYNEDFHYNIPLEERFHQQKLTDLPSL